MASEENNLVQVINSFDEQGKRTYFFAECQLPLQPPDTVLEQDPNLKMRHKKMTTVPIKTPNMPILTIDLEPSPVKFVPCSFYDYNHGVTCDVLIHPEVGYCDQHLHMAKDVSTAFENITRSLRISSCCRRQLFSGGKHGVKFNIIPEVEDYPMGDEPEHDNDLSVILNAQKNMSDRKQCEITLPTNELEGKPGTSMKVSGHQDVPKKNLNRSKPGWKSVDLDIKSEQNTSKHRLTGEGPIAAKKQRKELELRKFSSIFSEVEVEAVSKNKNYLKLIIDQAKEGKFAFGLSKRSMVHRISCDFDSRSGELTMKEFAHLCIKVPFKKFFGLLMNAWAVQNKKVTVYYEKYIQPFVKKLIRKKIIKVRRCGAETEKIKEKPPNEIGKSGSKCRKPCLVGFSTCSKHFVHFPEGYYIFHRDRTLLDYYKEFIFNKHSLIRHHPRFGRAGRIITAQRFTCRIPRSISKLLPQPVLQQWPMNQGNLPGRCASFSV